MREEVVEPEEEELGEEDVVAGLIEEGTPRVFLRLGEVEVFIPRGHGGVRVESGLEVRREGDSRVDSGVLGRRTSGEMSESVCALVNVVRLN